MPNEALLKANKVNDFQTPPVAVKPLLPILKKEEAKYGWSDPNRKWTIWECACGDGAISNVLLKHGYKVYSSDLVDRGFGAANHDFLTSQLKSDNIVTNPPFNLSLEFALKALQSAKRKVVFLHKLAFLESKKRHEQLFKLNKLEKVLIFSKRLGFKNNDRGGLMCFAWFIFDVNYNGKPTIDWI